MINHICNIKEVDPVNTSIHLKYLRELSHYTVRQIAYYCSISEKAVYAWENGTCIPSISHLIALKSLYKLSCLDDLLVLY